MENVSHLFHNILFNCQSNPTGRSNYVWIRLHDVKPVSRKHEAKKNKYMCPGSLLEKYNGGRLCHLFH